FYDHVDPPDDAVPPDNHTDHSKFNFKRLGVRVPTILLSPWLDQGIISDTFDHTSLLKFLIDKWGLSALGDRAAAANTFAKYLRKAPRETYKSLPAPAIASLLPSPAPTMLTDHQRSLVELGHYLATQIDDPAIRDPMLVRPAVATPEAEAGLA